MVDDRATAALRRLAARAGSVGVVDEAEAAVFKDQSAYGVIAYALETAPTAASAQADAIDGACIAVDGFGVGFVSTVPSGATIAHLAEDGSGFHADDLGNVQRRWDCRGIVTFAAPEYRDTDLFDLDRLGQLALSAAAAASTRPPQGRGLLRGGAPTDPPVAQARADLDKAYAVADAARDFRPAVPAQAHVEDVGAAAASSLRLALLQEVFPDIAASAGGIPRAAGSAPVSYFSSATGVAYMLGSCLGVYLDLRGDRFLKLFLACRGFRYELLVAPGVPALGEDAAAEAAAEL